MYTIKMALKTISFLVSMFAFSLQSGFLTSLAGRARETLSAGDLALWADEPTASRGNTALIVACMEGAPEEAVRYDQNAKGIFPILVTGKTMCFSQAYNGTGSRREQDKPQRPGCAIQRG